MTTQSPDQAPAGMETSAVAQSANKTQKRMKNSYKSAWWWTDSVVDSDKMRAVASSEKELLNATVLCAALSETQSEPNKSDKQANERAARELEMHVRKSPLPHTLQLPIQKITRDYVLMQSDLTLICAVRATKPADILQTVVGSAVPLSQPFVHRYGGARIHAPFWTRMQRLDLQGIHHLARQRKKVLLLCGHSIGGSIAHLAFCELVYQHLPTKTRLFLEKRDFDQQKNAQDTFVASDILNFGMMINGMTEDERATIRRSMPHVLAIGFGAPFVGSLGLNSFLEALQLGKRVITLVNEFDCIPSILNVAKSAAMVAKTSERFVTITKATKTLLNLLPIQTQQRSVDLTATTNTRIASTASSAYLSMSLSILQNIFQKFREFNVVKGIDYQYSPCGTYIFLSKCGANYKIFSNSNAISEVLHNEYDANSTLTGNAILQHLMSAYGAAVERRSTCIQINASMNFYERLGVPQNATERQIRSAYKRLALKWHPDRWASNFSKLQEQASAEEVFKLLAESYEVLSNTEARKAYDAHLYDAPSFKEEFMRSGTVNGMTLDEAIATFRDVIDNLSGAVSKVKSRFSTPSSTVVNPLRTSPSIRDNFLPNNHDNIFVPDRIRVARTVGIGDNQREQIMYLEPEDVLAGDIAAPAQAAGRSGANLGLRTVSVVGGAVAVGASVALIVNAWSQYSEMSKKKRQAEVVREMPSDCLLLLLEDSRNTQHFDTTQLLVKQADERKKRKYALVSASYTISSSGSNEGTAGNHMEKCAQQTLMTTKQQEDAAEDELIEEFFNCAAEYDSAALEAMADEEFYDCIELIGVVSLQFSDETLIEEKRIEEIRSEESSINERISFPSKSTVATPFGLATVQDWREGESSAIVTFICCKFMVGFIQKSCISRGASLAKAMKYEILESKRAKLVDRVVVRYHLGADEAASTIKSLVVASGDGALDSGIRAAGGVALANGVARTSSALGGAVAAPLTIASILVDIGKEYYDYRKRHTDRKSLGVLSTTTEQLMMHEFRLKTGEVIASRTAAAAGAGIGAYSVASALGMWSTAGLAAGPVGLVAATSAAIVGGMLGFFGGSKAYSASMAGYFSNHQNAKEHIDRLELGARLFFDEFDPDTTGTITKEDCIALLKKLYGAIGSTSDSGYKKTMAVIQDKQFEGPVTWGTFWEWVSSEAARTLCELNDEESKKVLKSADETWWSSYTKYFSYMNARKAVPLLAEPNAVMYPSVKAMLGVVVSNSIASISMVVGPEADDAEEESLVLKAQVEFLVNNSYLTSGDAFQLLEQLASDDPLRKEFARKTIVAMHEGLSVAGQQHNLVCDGFGFTGGNMMGISVFKSNEEKDANRTKTAVSGAAKDHGKRCSDFDERLDVMCSLMSTHGLQRFLQRQNIHVQDEALRHEDLHCLALMASQTSAPSI